MPIHIPTMSATSAVSNLTGPMSSLHLGDKVEPSDKQVEGECEPESEDDIPRDKHYDFDPSLLEIRKVGVLYH